MKTNLSSQIKLNQIPKKYYAPESKLEYAALCREEKVFTTIAETTEEGVAMIAEEVAATIRKNVAQKGKCVLALGAGNSVLPIYEELERMYEQKELDFSNVIVFNLYEFDPSVELESKPSTFERLNSMLLSKVNIKPGNVYTFKKDMLKSDIYEECKAYEAEIDACGGLDLVMCEIGAMGNLAFNEVGSKFSSSCRLTLIDQATRKSLNVANNAESVPATALTLGLSNILSAKKVISMAWGEENAKVVHAAIEGPLTEAVPASVLQMHRNAKVIVDLSASEELTRISKPWLVTSCEWTDKLIRRAIAWLCEKTGKPILKLTNADFNEWGLNELAANYGSAYNVNIKIFNDIQHTITGWPGGKPNADDSNRPERALPYPKRVIVFSPHPDDDVISMGGTLKRLVDQKHDVHVAYETSGNIAVGDEDMFRYILVMDQIAKEFGLDSETYLRKSQEIKEFLAAKRPGDIDTLDIRTLKGRIRRAEAKTACNYIGVKPENVHHLDLPFYETGAIKKGDLTERDVKIVKDLIASVKPHQIFVAGDLADPHGTHRVCTDAVFAAVDELLDEDWMADCRIWMYRGAWAEWEIDHIEMAVPISPEELRFKRNAILKHQSQMENAPFLGDDDRLFWQRAEDRNRATAQLYSRLGLASYEAMEAFVEYHPIR